MQTLNLTQGSPEWLEARARYYTASEASAMMGASPHMSRADLLKLHHSGSEKEISVFTAKIFDHGHEIEAATRPLIEKDIGRELYPCMVVDDAEWLSASLDGMTMEGDVIWEGKQFSQTKVDHIKSTGECPPEDYWQVMQQLLITGARKCIYTVGDGTMEGTIFLDVRPDDDAFEKLKSGWHQFQADLNNYEPPQPVAEVTGARPESLPALRIEVTGMVTASNIGEFKSHALAVFDGISTELATDQDFADADEAVKFCKEVEDRLDAAKQHALSQTESIDALFRAIDEISEAARRKRLDLDKLRKARKEQRRTEIITQALEGLRAHYEQINAGLGHGIVLSVPQDFRAAVVASMKNKRTISSLMDSADQALADAKIKASQDAQTIAANLKQYDELAANHRHLFADLRTLVGKAPDDFAASIKLRIAEHQENERKREEEQRERIRREEEEKAKAAVQNVQPASPARQDAEPAASAPVTQSRPAAEGVGTAPEPTKPGNIAWRVTCTFDLEVGSNVPASAIETELRRVMGKAGITTLSSVQVQQHKEAA